MSCGIQTFAAPARQGASIRLGTDPHAPYAGIPFRRRPPGCHKAGPPGKAEPCSPTPALCFLGGTSRQASKLRAD